jgi:hypothetical protein
MCVACFDPRKYRLTALVLSQYRRKHPKIAFTVIIEWTAKLAHLCQSFRVQMATAEQIITIHLAQLLPLQ